MGSSGTAPGPSRQGFEEPEKDRASWESAVVDLRRAIDLLLARPDVDRARIGYVGHSYGAQWGAILTALDRRIKASVLVGGVPSGESTTVELDDPDVVAMVKGCPPEQLEAYFRINRPYDAIRYVPYPRRRPSSSSSPAMSAFVTDAAMRRYFEVASAPKLERRYDAGHELNDPRALADRCAWLAPKLLLPLMAPILAKRLATDIK
jgi:pimeloyl-ACP methyl ester carboxylesterase